MPLQPLLKRLIASLLALIVLTVLTTRATASEEVVLPGHSIAVTIPDGWERHRGLADPVIFTLVEPSTGNSFGLLAVKQTDDKFKLDRKSAESGILEKIGASGKILRRMDTKFAGVAAYCVVAETQFQGRTVSIARIMAEHPLNGFLYVIQYSKMGGGDFDDAAIQAIVGSIHTTKSK